MTPLVACFVCARPLESLLTNGLHAGVAVMALVAIAVIGALVRGAVVVVREDAATGHAAPGVDAGVEP